MSTAVLSRSSGIAQPKPVITIPKVDLPTQSALYSALYSELRKEARTYFKAIPNIEGMSEEEVRAIKVTSESPLAPAERVVADAGFNTDGTAGSIMDSPFAWTREDVHDIACFCVEERIGHQFNGEILSVQVARVQGRHAALSAA